MITKTHHFAILSKSPWPLISSLNSFGLLFSLIVFFKFNDFSSMLVLITTTIITSLYWWTTYRGEINLEGRDSLRLELSVKSSILLFISSEIFFFFSFFWSYFHFFLSPSIEIAMIWPPLMVECFNPTNIPLVNTLILIASGATVTARHHYLCAGQTKICKLALLATIVLGVIFSYFQAMEYGSRFFEIRDGNFGSSFFILTGFHGLHVLVGTIFLRTVLYRLNKITMTKGESLRFELSSWYWHFVDVVWIFLYFVLYYLNS